MKSVFLTDTSVWVTLPEFLALFMFLGNKYVGYQLADQMFIYCLNFKTENIEKC